MRNGSDLSNQVEVSPLFRPEVLTAHSAQWLGTIRLAQPVSGWLIAGSASIITTCLIVFIIFGDITKKTRVAGITVPSNGSITIIAPNAGVLINSHVLEGQQVSAGQTLFELSTERQGSQGEITVLVSQQLAIRQQTIESEKRLRIAQASDKRKAIDERLLNVGAEVSQLEQEISLVQHRQSLAQKSLGSFETLQGGGICFSSANSAKARRFD